MEDDLLYKAKQGDAEAQYQLGERYEKNPHLNYAEAVKWYLKAAEQGHADAQNELAWLYSKGMGVPVNSREAAKWFKRAAEQGHPEAMKCQYTIIERAVETIGDIDAEKYFLMKNAEEWGEEYKVKETIDRLVQFAEQGDIETQYDLGEKYRKWYYTGNSLQDLFEAVRWFRKAAKLGHSKAQSALISLYENNHRAFVALKKQVYKGIRVNISNRHRVTHCYNCKCQLDNDNDIECNSCGWIICSCGACGCGYTR